MFENWTFGRKVGAGFAVAGAILLLVAVFGYRSTYGLIEDQSWVVHTFEVRGELTELISRLADAETGQRGFVITGNDAFLTPYRAALQEIRRGLGDLRRLTADNARQQERLDRLQPLVDAKLAELRRTIDLRRREGFAATAEVISAGTGRGLMVEIRTIVRAMEREEADLLRSRRASAEASAEVTQSVILWGSLGGLVLVAMIAWLLTRSLSQQIGAAVGHMHSSSAELQSAANQQATSAREQSSAMNEITTTIRELLATSHQIAESAQQVARIAGQTAAAARSGDALVGSGHDSIGAIRRQVDVIVGHMIELGKKSQQIGSVLDIVGELSEQTNILAINASVEAAGAGEAGRRFAVVAEEIRKLAVRVAGSAKDIRGLIEDVRSAVNTTVMVTEIGSKAVDAGAKQFAEVASSFTEIASLVSTTTDAAKEIELSTKQQATAVEQVNVGTSNVAQAAKETQVTTAQTLQTASQLATLSRDLLKLVQPQAAARSDAA